MIKLKFLIALLFITFWSNAQPLAKSLLWKISGNGLEKPSYLFGTIHLTCDATLSPKVKKALDDTQQLYLELDMDDTTMQATMMQHMMMDNGTKMTDLASKADTDSVDAFLKENLGMGLELMNTIKPVFLSMMLTTKMLDCPIQSVEQELMKITQEQGETINGLELVDDQIAALDAIPYKEQMDDLVKSAKDDLADDKKEINDLLAIYKTEDIEGLLKLSKESDESASSKHDKELLETRNISWIPKIGQAAKEKATLFAVGAAHLAGENGVIRLLRKSGFTVEAVN